MEVVVIRFIDKYDRIEEIVGVAINMNAAKEYAEMLKEEYLCYGENWGSFFFEEHRVIEECR